MLRQTSLGALGLVVGGILTVVGFAAYFADNATLNLAGFFYGIPVLLGGLALKAAELKPIPFTQATSSEVLARRETAGYRHPKSSPQGCHPVSLWPRSPFIRCPRTSGT